MNFSIQKRYLWPSTRNGLEMRTNFRIHSIWPRIGQLKNKTTGKFSAKKSNVTTQSCFYSIFCPYFEDFQKYDDGNCSQIDLLQDCINENQK